MAKPNVLMAGNEGCKASGRSHLEYIDGNLVGRCRCGRVVSYATTPRNWLAAAQAAGGRKAKGKPSPRKGMTLAEYQAGGPSRRPVGSANEASNAWNDMSGQHSERALVKGVDFL